MNPFTVNHIIIKSRRNGEKLVVEELSRKCGVELRHAHLVMSKDYIKKGDSGKCSRRWVKRVSLYGWFSLWRYCPPKTTDFSPVQRKDLKSMSELKAYKDVMSDNKKKHII